MSKKEETSSLPTATEAAASPAPVKASKPKAAKAPKAEKVALEAATTVESDASPQSAAPAKPTRAAKAAALAAATAAASAGMTLVAPPAELAVPAEPMAAAPAATTIPAPAMAATAEAAPVRLAGFAALGLSPAMIDALAKKGFEEPTKIQAEVVPLLLKGDTDIIAQSHTGTGKTAAFGLPLLELLSPARGPAQALVLVPTRELAIQVSEELNSLRPKKPGGMGDLHIVPIYGGQSYELQFRHFRQGIDIVVGTPGRIIDHLTRGSLNLTQVQYVVLDEADEMLDMGFIDDIEAILGMCTTRKHMLLFSATMPPRIRDVASTWMKDAKHVSVKTSSINASLTDQIYFEVMERDKFEALGRIIDIEPDFYGLVFCRTKIDCDNVSSKLIERGYDADTLHGDVSQAVREKVLDKFRRKVITILVATDVAARGIDVDSLTHVINFSLPTDAESYVHRIGRTGRAGREGTAITFVSPEEFRKLRYIQSASRSDIRREKVPSIEDVLARKRQRIFSQLAGLTGPSLPEGTDPASVTPAATTVPQSFLDLADELLAQATAKGTDTRSLLGALLHHSLRDELDAGRYRKITELEPGGRKPRDFGTRDGYSQRDGYGNRDNFAPRDNYSRDAGDYGAPRSRTIPEGAVRLYVARGVADGFTKPRLVEFIRKTAKVRDRDIDGVEVYEFYSFISVPLAEAERILHVFQSGEAERGKDGKPIVRAADAGGAGGPGGSGGGKFRSNNGGGHNNGHYGKKPYGKFQSNRG